ncbi:hypothetical protein Taro_040442 [Colocasia esculenta]|uniref:Uncharacterized protein n=1 Tax=Colocasia esculenta TaxID=4460 RepID=A0A843WYF2_COLES|nr:hypothetical protein [Colocasia esculenta]
MSESSIDENKGSTYMKHRVNDESNSCTTCAIGVGSQVEFTTFHWPCYRHVQRSGVILGYNQLVDHVRIHGQRRLTEALNKDSLVRQKEYPRESLFKSRESGITSSSTMWESMNRGDLWRP